MRNISCFPIGLDLSSGTCLNFEADNIGLNCRQGYLPMVKYRIQSHDQVVTNGKTEYNHMARLVTNGKK